MGKAVYLDVDGRKVLTTEVTYDDLVTLYKQYIEKYGEVPNYKVCDSKHNMPQGRIITKIFNNKNITRDEFLKQFGITTRLKEKTINSIMKNIIDSFPFKTSENIYYLLSDNIKLEKKNDVHNKYVVDLYDVFGYKYKIDYNFLISAKNGNYELNKFFKRNPYTYDNINLWCELNNIDLHIDRSNLPVSGYARKILDFTDSNGNIIKTSWNHITRYKVKCKTDEEKIKVKNRTYMSKEKAIPIILAKEEELQRPLLQKDFECVKTSDNSVGIRVIWRLWGNFNNMIDELGLKKHDCYYKPNSCNYIPHNEVMEYIKFVCNDVKEQNRNIVSYSDFKDIEITKIIRHCKKDNTTLNNIVNLYGCELQQAGIGMNHKFEDGEYTVAKYEYDFSSFLRENGFKYGKTYFRNVYYKKLDKEYTGNMNCDYKIDFGNKTIYIELAGILGNKEHQEAYRNNIPIKSKSKEEYRQKLNQKREIFERNNLEYYILLPDEMNEDNYKRIFKKYLKEVA